MTTFLDTQAAEDLKDAGGATTGASRLTGKGEELVTVYRGMGRDELKTMTDLGRLESKAMRNPHDPAGGQTLGQRLRHTFKGSGKPRSPYVSVTTQPAVARTWAKRPGTVVVRMQVPRSELRWSVDRFNQEYLVLGGTPVRHIAALEGKALALERTTLGSKIRWAGESLLEAGIWGTVPYTGGRALGEGPLGDSLVDVYVQVTTDE